MYWPDAISCVTDVVDIVALRDGASVIFLPDENVNSLVSNAPITFES
jgi:hypothetical protein